MTLPPADSYKFIVTWFHKDSDRLGDLVVGQVDAPSMSVETVQSLFRLEKLEDAFAGCYPVTVKEKDSVEHLASVSLDLDAFDYFVEAVQT